MVEEVIDSISESEADSYVEPPLGKPPTPAGKMPTKAAKTAILEAVQPAQLPKNVTRLKPHMSLTAER